MTNISLTGTVIPETDEPKVVTYETLLQWKHELAKKMPVRSPSYIMVNPAVVAMLERMAYLRRRWCERQFHRKRTRRLRNQPRRK